MTSPSIQPVAAPYAANADARVIANVLRPARRVIVTTHAKPDGDAVGSSVALARAITTANPDTIVEVWLVGPWPAWLDEIASTTPVRRLNADEPVAPGFVSPSLGAEPDAIAICDTGSRVQLGPMVEWLAARSERSVIIDHHLQGDASLARHRFIDATAAATTELVAKIADELLNLTGDALFPREIAEPLYLGAGTDTGWFRFSNVTPRTLRMAARLIESGTDSPALYALVNQQDTPARPRLLGAALASITYHALSSPIATSSATPITDQPLVAIMTLTRDDLARLDARTEDTGGFADPVMSVRAVAAVVTLTEHSKPGAPLVKASLRSKPGPGAIDVASACASLGGGGHARAAGVKLAMTLDDARRAVLDALGATHTPIELRASVGAPTP